MKNGVMSIVASMMLPALGFVNRNAADKLSANSAGSKKRKYVCFSLMASQSAS